MSGADRDLVTMIEIAKELLAVIRKNRKDAKKHPLTGPASDWKPIPLDRQAVEDLCGLVLAQNEIEEEEEDDEEDTYPVKDWQYEVANGDTVLGYTDWLRHKKEGE